MGVKAKLTVEAGIGRGREYVLEEGRPFYVGRDRKCDYYVASSQVSRVHCKIEGQGGSFAIFDLESRNGTFVNGKQVASRALRHGDVITAGGSKLRLEVAEPLDTQLSRMGATPEASGPIVVPPKPKAGGGAGATGFESELGFFGYSEAEKSLVGKFVGDLKMLALAGKGQRCVTYKAAELSKNRIVAIKMLGPDLADDPDAKRWLVRGAKRSAELRHENVVGVMGGAREGDRPYVVMQYMEKSAFERFRDAAAGGFPTVKSALQALVNVTRALEFGFQEHKQLHGGLRPSKILYDEDRQPKLAGLGFDHGPGTPGVQAQEQLLAYVAPELANRSSEPTVQTDIYGLGASFYYMLAGVTPARDGTGAWPSPRLLNTAVPDPVERILDKMSAPSPSDRYTGYAELLHDVRWALRGDPLRREEGPAPERG